MSDTVHRPPEDAEPMAVSAELDRSAVDLAAGRGPDAFDRVRRVLAEISRPCASARHAWSDRGRRGRRAVGFASLQRAVALDPRLEHRVWLALCLAKIGCAEDAAKLMIAGTGVDALPPTANAHFAVGMVLHALGQYDEAARFYASCVALDPPARTPSIAMPGRFTRPAGSSPRSPPTWTRPATPAPRPITMPI